MRRPHSSLFILHSDNPLPGRPVLYALCAPEPDGPKEFSAIN